MSIPPLPRRLTLPAVPGPDPPAGLLPRCANAAEVRRVAPGRPEYDTSGFHNLFMGSGYRELWTTPIDFEVLDLRSFAGGLTPVRQVGSMQSIGLAMKGAGRPELHLQDQRQGPEAHPAPRVGRHRARAAVPGRDHREPPRRRLRDAAARGGGGCPAHDAPLRVHARRPRARGVPRHLRRQAGHDRGVPAARSRRLARVRRRHRDRLDGRAVEAPSRRPGARRRAGARARAALRPLDPGLGPPQQAVALAAARRGRRLRAAARGPRPGLLALRRPAALDRAGHAPEVHGLRRRVRELRGLDDPGRRGGPLAALGGRPRASSRRRRRSLRRGSRTRSSTPRSRGCRASGTRSTARASRRRSRSAAPTCCRRRSSSTSASPRRWTSTPPTWPIRCAWRAARTGASRWRSRAPPARRRGSKGASTRAKRARCGSTSTRDPTR